MQMEQTRAGRSCDRCIKIPLLNSLHIQPGSASVQPPNRFPIPCQIWPGGHDLPLIYDALARKWRAGRGRRCCFFLYIFFCHAGICFREIACFSPRGWGMSGSFDRFEFIAMLRRNAKSNGSVCVYMLGLFFGGSICFSTMCFVQVQKQRE